MLTVTADALQAVEERATARLFFPITYHPSPIT